MSQNRSQNSKHSSRRDDGRKTFHRSSRRADDRPAQRPPQRQPQRSATVDRKPAAAPQRSAGTTVAFASGPIDASQPGFTGFGLDDKLLRGIAAMGFDEPTPIQKMGVPPAMQGRDVLACAMTGSGKTASFLLPVLQRLLMTRPAHPKAVRALVLTPTRELAAQVVQQFRDLGQFTNLRAEAVFGGVGMGPQEQAFRRGVDLMVACPGRLLDHLGRPYADLRDLEVLVLDEVDRMLDMGFLPDVRRVLSQIPRVQQTLCYSATMPRDIVELTDELQRDPVKLQIERESKPAEGVRQLLYPVNEGNKRELLLRLLDGPDIFNALVFTRTKHRANRIADFLGKNGVATERIHGNRSQAQRTRALAQFKKGKARVLVATDVAARGIDVEDLSHVINFDVPNVPEDYIHRVGRTARAERTGDALSFVSEQEESFIRSIEKTLGEKLPRKYPDGTATDGSKAQPAAATSEGDRAERPRQHSHRPKHGHHARPNKSANAGRKSSGQRSRSRQRA